MRRAIACLRFLPTSNVLCWLVIDLGNNSGRRWGITALLMWWRAVRLLIRIVRMSGFPWRNSTNLCLGLEVRVSLKRSFRIWGHLKHYIIFIYLRASLVGSCSISKIIKLSLLLATSAIVIIIASHTIISCRRYLAALSTCFRSSCSLEVDI